MKQLMKSIRTIVKARIDKNITASGQKIETIPKTYLDYI